MGKEDSVFLPACSMSIQVAIRTHTEPGDLILTDHSAHLIRSEGGAAAALSGVTMKPLPGVDGVFTPADINNAIEPLHRFNPVTLSPRMRLLCVENTHNAGGGTVWPLEQIHAVATVAHAHGLVTHLDGARLWHATAASGVSEGTYAEPFDTVNVCFSKGLGAPVGSALAGPRDLIARSRRFKQQFGGGFRQAGILAAGALHALEHHRDDLVKDIKHARQFAAELEDLDGLEVDLDRVQSNIVRFSVQIMSAGDFVHRCHEQGVHMLPSGPHGIRAVLHRDVDTEDLNTALEVVTSVLHSSSTDLSHTSE